ncbi:SpoIIE family protein phosphatase [Streptomyces cavernae]|uniref:SpoIIE family protein phosphatase n=1 Tax=Streptomyces cavernae TaxID=2259034 RepID=UPI000FEC08EC|nr:SpoIIE family protein phosphatase [Streptomyces cavernae]
MTDVVTEGAAGRRTANLRVELALKALPADLAPRERLRSVLELVLAFTSATAVAVYAPRGDGEDFRLVASAGAPGNLYGLHKTQAGSGALPVADVHLLGRPVWLPPDDMAPSSGDRTAPAPASSPTRDFSLAVLPVPGEDPAPGGCLVAAGDTPDGFDAEDRRSLQLLAEAATCPAPSARAGEPGGFDPAELPASSFSLAMDSGRVDVDDDLLELFGLGREQFDGKVETFLARTVPEDLPALMSVVEADHMSIGDRELEFRITTPSGVPRWLRLRAQLLPGGDVEPARLVGTVAEASGTRPGANDVARVQRLASALATAGTVRDVSKAVSAALRQPLSADRIALAELEADRLVVTFLDPPQPEAWPELWRTEWRSEWPDAPVRAMPTLAAALREGRAAIWPAGASLEPALADVGPGGLAVLPLPAAGRMAGACLIGWDSPHHFGPDERALLTAAAGLTGQALMRAHAFDAEHELIGMLQRTLLPRRLPTLPGGVAVARYLPTTAGLEVGGDWYDVIPLPHNHVGLVIGDVQGHSASAATVMGQMRTALRAYAIEGHPPDVVVAHANRLLVDMETDLFATCCYVDLDMEEGTAWCVRAGHLPPVLRHPDSSTEIVPTDGGPPLGVISQADFPMTQLSLLPGTVLALTTDGLVESAELDLEDGLLRLSEVFSAADPGDLGLTADALLADANRRDDVALLLIRYDGMATRPLRESWTVWRVPEAVGHARRFTRRTLRAWNLTAEADTILLVVSELVTNALIHTAGQVRMDLTHINDRFRVAVADASPRTPVKSPNLSWESTGGRGILLVEAMSESWGTLPVSGGKQVWAEIVVGQEES